MTEYSGVEPALLWMCSYVIGHFNSNAPLYHS